MNDAKIKKSRQGGLLRGEQSDGLLRGGQSVDQSGYREGQSNADLAGR